MAQRLINSATTQQPFFNVTSLSTTAFTQQRAIDVKQNNKSIVFLPYVAF